MISLGSEGGSQGFCRSIWVQYSINSDGSEDMHKNDNRIVVKERGLLSMGFGPVLFLLLLGGVMGVFFYSLTNISKRSAMKDERLINKNHCNI